MTQPARPTSRRRTSALTAVTALSLASLAAGVASVAVPLSASAQQTQHAVPAKAKSGGLPVGDAKLPEKRTVRTLAPGVVHTKIVRGDKTATPARIARTTTGPWQVNVVMVDPKRSKLRLSTTYGTTLMAPSTVTDIAVWARAKVAMNGSFFNHGGPSGFKGDPVGLTVQAGQVVSEQTGTGSEHNVVFDSRTGRMTMGRMTWKGYVKNTKTEKVRTLAGVNRLPRVPTACLPTPPVAPTPQNPNPEQPAPGPRDPQGCSKTPGELVRFAPGFSTRTPSGPGAEAVYGSDGCLVRVSPTRGTKLTPAQFSIQGTGGRADQIMRESEDGCVTLDETVFDSNGEKVELTSTSFGLSGRYRLVRDGSIVETRGTSSLVGRNPRSLMGRTADGRVALVTIDGRRTTSVGTTLIETAKIARSLGLVEAINLDGGGSTTLVIDRKVANTVSGSRQRLVSDGIILS